MIRCTGVCSGNAWWTWIPPKFNQLVMECVTTTHFSVKVNGAGYDFFEGKRRLRQGDPMSPLLFVLVIEYFSRLLARMSKFPDFRFPPPWKKQLSHLIEDLMIFCKGNKQSGKMSTVLCVINNRWKVVLIYLQDFLYLVNLASGAYLAWTKSGMQRCPRYSQIDQEK